jgi:predicted TIM-barrel fold metal-dependent hydrolase
MLDIYGFIGTWPYWEIAHKTPEALLALMDRSAIKQLAICSTRAIFSDWRIGNEEAISLAEKYPDRFIPFVSLGPAFLKAELVDYLKRYKARNVRGIRLYPYHQSFRLTKDHRVAKVLETAEELHLPVMLPIRVIMNWGLPQLDTGSIEAVVASFPNLPFILSSVNYGEFNWARELMRVSPNVFLEISGLQGFRILEHAVKAMGPEKILFGTGLPLMYPACSVVKVTNAKLTPEQKLAVSEGNARRLLGF